MEFNSPARQFESMWLLLLSKSPRWDLWIEFFCGNGRRVSFFRKEHEPMMIFSLKMIYPDDGRRVYGNVFSGAILLPRRVTRGEVMTSERLGGWSWMESDRARVAVAIGPFSEHALRGAPVSLVSVKNKQVGADTWGVCVPSIPASAFFPSSSSSSSSPRLI